MKLKEGYIEQHNNHLCVNQLCEDGINTLKNIIKLWKHNKLSCEKIKNLTAEGKKLADILDLLTNINNQIVNGVQDSVANPVFYGYNATVE